MKTLPILSLALGLGVAMCGTQEHPQPATQAKIPAAEPAAKPAAQAAQEEKPMAEARWTEVAAAAERFLIVKIADGKHRPKDDFDGKEGLSGKTLFYLLVPHSAAAAEISHESGGKKSALPKPKMIHRMPGSALYTWFSADPAQPGSLAFKVGGKAETVSLAGRTAALQGIPFFWSGEGQSIAFEEIPGWMEGSGP